jgi:hypothetical protein
LAELAAQFNRTRIAEDGLPGVAGAGSLDKAAEGAGGPDGTAIGGLAAVVAVTVTGLLAVLATVVSAVLVTVLSAVAVTVMVVSAGDRLDDGGSVLVPAAGVGDGHAAFLVGTGRAEPQAAQPTSQQRPQQATP